MNCKTCKAKLPSLYTRLKQVNEDLHTIGTKYWPSLSEAFQAIDGALILNSLSEMCEATDESGTETSLHCNIGEGKWLHISWHRMSSGNFEVTAYVN